ncbi:MAG: DUF1015 family protein [Lachnospiraceae bacterium]|nr:DUF1015 family protein [Lachnospiraceae bacterium]
MNDVLKRRFLKVGLRVPEILMPAPEVDLSKFAVIACDQHSAEPAYWAETERIVGEAPSALRLMLPEAYLAEKERYEPKISEAMRQYLDAGILTSVGEGFVYVRREVAPGVLRRGLVAAIDLESYDYKPGNHNRIRATEATVKERLPERIKIRSGAPIELPHVLVLLDDERNHLSGLLEEKCATLPKLYDFDLMQGGGHIDGTLIEDEELLTDVADVLEELAAKCEDNFLMAVGDGNHSLAAAKECWEARKSELMESNFISTEMLTEDPLRYALVELISVYDEGLSFHPIHRLIMHVDPEDQARMVDELGLDRQDLDLQKLQPALDAWMGEYRKTHPAVELEYIHGREECLALGDAPDCYPIVFDKFERGSFFKTVLTNGTFVRKSFSLGEAREKRYYLESRRIR